MQQTEKDSWKAERIHDEKLYNKLRKAAGKLNESMMRRYATN